MTTILLFFGAVYGHLDVFHNFHRFLVDLRNVLTIFEELSSLCVSKTNQIDVRDSLLTRLHCRE